MFEDFEYVDIETNLNQVRENIFFQEGDYSAAIDGIDVCEVNGRRSEQQDTLFVARLNRHIAAPFKFFREHITNIAKKHQNCLAGTTLCSAIVAPATPEQLQEGKTFPTLAIGSLGDSPAVIIFRLRDGEKVRHLSLALTEDHSLDVERIKNHVEANGGTIAADALGELRVVNKDFTPLLNMGAAIGNCALKSNVEGASPLKIEPDVLGYDVNKLITIFALPEEKVEAADLILSCDGLHDLMLKDASGILQETSLAVDQRAKITLVDGKNKIEFQAVESKSGVPHLSQLAQNFYDQGGQGNFAEELVRSALRFDSSDNISVIRISLMNVTKDLIAAVCDGHGIGVSPVESNPDAPNFADGKLVSASVASDLFVAARAVPITQLEEQTPKGIFHQMLEAKRSAILASGKKSKANSAEVLPTEQVNQNSSSLTVSTMVSDDSTNLIQTPTSLNGTPDLNDLSPSTSFSNQKIEKLQNSELVKEL